MMRHSWLALVFPVLFFLEAAAGGGAKKVEPGKIKESYYPLQDGNQWTYTLTVNDKMETMTTKVAKIDKIGKEEYAILEAWVKGKIAGSEHLRETDKGIFRYRTNGIEAKPAVCLLKYPVKAGDKWGGKFDAAGNTAKYACESQEEMVLYKNEKIKTMRVDIRLEEKKGTEDKVNVVLMTYWFAKDLGFVKQTVKAGPLTILLELENFTAKK